jgi:hypothetical protein
MINPVEIVTDMLKASTHLARCPVCDFTISYIPSESGNSYALVDADPELALGIGSNGRPICRNGEHGEMEIADDRQDEPAQQSLPGIIPPFNYEGAYLELEAKAVEVERLAKIYAEDAATAKESRKDWESAAKVFSTMALEFRRRRRAKVEQLEAASEDAPGEQLFTSDEEPVENDAANDSGE